MGNKSRRARRHCLWKCFLFLNKLSYHVEIFFLIDKLVKPRAKTLGYILFFNHPITKTHSAKNQVCLCLQRLLLHFLPLKCCLEWEFLKNKCYKSHFYFFEYNKYANYVNVILRTKAWHLQICTQKVLLVERQFNGSKPGIPTFHWDKWNWL